MLISQYKNTHNNISCMTLDIRKGVPLAGDVKIILFNRDGILKWSEILHFWFNTAFLHKINISSPSSNSDKNDDEKSTNEKLYLSLKKAEIDRAYKDKECKYFENDFSLNLFCDELNSNSPNSRTNSEHTVKYESDFQKAVLETMKTYEIEATEFGDTPVNDIKNLNDC